MYWKKWLVCQEGGANEHHTVVTDHKVEDYRRCCGFDGCQRSEQDMIEVHFYNPFARAWLTPLLRGPMQWSDSSNKKKLLLHVNIFQACLSNNWRKALTHTRIGVYCISANKRQTHSFSATLGKKWYSGVRRPPHRLNMITSPKEVIIFGARKMKLSSPLDGFARTSTYCLISRENIRKLVFLIIFRAFDSVYLIWHNFGNLA